MSRLDTQKMKRSMKALAMALTGLLLAVPAAYAEEEPSLLAFSASDNAASVQRGARDFMAYCSGCHSLKYLRYNRIGQDLGISDDLLKANLIFDGSKLSDVVQEFNRYNKRQLVIEGSQLSDFHVSGVYSSSDPASLIRFLRDQPGIKIREDENQVLIASP